MLHIVTYFVILIAAYKDIEWMIIFKLNYRYGKQLWQ